MPLPPSSFLFALSYPETTLKRRGAEPSYVAGHRSQPNTDWRIWLFPLLL